MAGFFFPDFNKNNKNLELHSTSISIMDLPSYDAMISNEPILKSSNYEILNSAKLLARELDVNFTNIKPLAMRINIHDKRNFKIFEYNRSFHYDDITHHFVTDAFSSCLYHRYTIPKIQTTSLFVKYKHIRNKSKMCLTRITPTYQIELLIPLFAYIDILVYTT